MLKCIFWYINENFYKIHIKSHMGGQKLSVIIWNWFTNISFYYQNFYRTHSEASEVSSNIFMIHISQKVGQKGAF